MEARSRIYPVLSGIAVSWLLIALWVGQAKLLRALPVFAIPILIFSLTGLVLLSLLQIPSLRNWILTVNIRALLLLHVTRFVGIYFLVLYGRGELPYEFAVKGGWGDIFAAVTVLLVCCLPMRGATSWYAVFVWNCLGLLDILFVVTTPLRLRLQGLDALPEIEQLGAAITQLPLSLLPTFLVPLIIASHILIFARLSSSRKRNFDTL